MNEPTGFDDSVLNALQEGFRARAGAKERFRALSEYEVARRLGIVDCSYVEYDSSPERSAVRASLSRLQHRGLVQVVSVSGRYETFVPSDETHCLPVPVTDHEPPEQQADGSLPPTFEGGLVEIVRLLRSIDERLGRIERA